MGGGRGGQSPAPPGRIQRQQRAECTHFPAETSPSFSRPRQGTVFWRCGRPPAREESQRGHLRFAAAGRSCYSEAKVHVRLRAEATPPLLWLFRSGTALFPAAPRRRAGTSGHSRGAGPSPPRPRGFLRGLQRPRAPPCRRVCSANAGPSRFKRAPRPPRSPSSRGHPALRPARPRPLRAPSPSRPPAPPAMPPAP